MSDKVKTKKIDLRLAEELFEEITLVGWVSGQKRSELLRLMIRFFVEHGSVQVNGQNLGWESVLSLARAKQERENLAFAEVCEEMSGRTARRTELEVNEQLHDELQGFAEIYAKNAIEAFKKHTGGRNDG